MDKKKFTIITVCYNAEKYIKETIESLLCQTCEDYEYIIKDGGSTDKTLEIAHALLDDKENAYIVSNPDKGIYDAMNQAVELARGEYIYFLNAGDRLYNADVLRHIKKISEENEADLIYGSIVLEDKDVLIDKRYGNIYQQPWMYLLGDCICHQALFTRKDEFENKKFDTSYKICADREMQLFSQKKGCKYICTKDVVAQVLVDGYSLQNVEVYKQETRECLKKYYSSYVWIYDVFCRIKQNKVVHWILGKIYNRL